MFKGKILPEEKITAARLCLDKGQSIAKVARTYGVSWTRVYEWVHSYESMGAEAFNTSKPKKYPADVKQKAVREYLDGQGSLVDICKKYGIRSKELLRQWIQVYSCHETLKSSGTGRNAFMTKGRKTTFDERIEIVKFCIEHGDNYAVVAAKYGISCQQARSYATKFKERGIEGLKDRRGKRKDISEMDEKDLLRAENKLLKLQVRRSTMMELLSKKLDEIERRRG